MTSKDMLKRLLGPQNLEIQDLDRDAISIILDGGDEFWVLVRKIREQGLLVPAKPAKTKAKSKRKKPTKPKDPEDMDL